MKSQYLCWFGEAMKFVTQSTKQVGFFKQKLLWHMHDTMIMSSLINLLLVSTMLAEPAKTFRYNMMQPGIGFTLSRSWTVGTLLFSLGHSRAHVSHCRRLPDWVMVNLPCRRRWLTERANPWQRHCMHGTKFGPQPSSSPASYSALCLFVALLAFIAYPYSVYSLHYHAASLGSKTQRCVSTISVQCPNQTHQGILGPLALTLAADGIWNITRASGMRSWWNSWA